jgi:hypothetical protein
VTPIRVTCDRLLSVGTGRRCAFAGDVVFRDGRAVCPTCRGPLYRPVPSTAEMLAFEASYPYRDPAREEAIRRDLSLTPARYYQLLGRAIDTEDALRIDPVLTHRLRRLRDTAAAASTARLQSTHP